MSSQPNTGGLWANTRKYSPSDPDFKGVLNVDGREIKFVGWHSNSKHPQAPKINLRVDSHSLPPVFQTTTEVVKDEDIPF